MCIYSLFLALHLVSSQQDNIYLLFTNLLHLFLADIDFVPLVEYIVFTSSGVKCINVTLVTGDTVEHLEQFSVVLTTHDERLEIKEYFVPVYILDDDGES